jgi:outer membrane protein insertion porin family
LGYIYENTKLTDISESLKDSIYYQEGERTKSSFVPAIRYDNTDDYYLPRRGMNLSLSTEYAGVGGDVKFTRYSFVGKFYKGLEDVIDYDLILRARIKAITIKDRSDADKPLPLNEKLYLGGYSSLRGFKAGTLAPRDSAGSLIGAKKMASFTLEASIPLVKSMGLRAKAFYDYGTTGNDTFKEIHRNSVGLGLE